MTDSPLVETLLSDVVVERRASADINTRMTDGRPRLLASTIGETSRRASLFKSRANAAAESTDRCFTLVRHAIHEDEAKPDTRTASRPIRGFLFDVLTEEEIVRRSAVRITSPQCISTRTLLNPLTNKSHVEHYQNPYGPLSSYMGPLDRSSTCLTCEGSYNYDYALNPDRRGVYPCPGHPGHIITPGATFSVTFTNHNQLVEIHLLRCICWMCGDLPASAKKREATIRAALRCDANGEPLDRERRLDIILRAMQGEKYCHACQAKIRCDECRNADAQCDGCVELVEFRPRIESRGKTGATSEFLDFPRVVRWPVETLKTDKDRAQFEAFKKRHPRLTETELSFNPERARAMFSVISAEVALLLAPQLPRGPYRSSGDVFTRVFGERSPSEMRDLRLSAIKAAKDFFHGMTSRVVNVIEHCATPARVNGGLHDVTFNEMTKIVSSIVTICETIKKKAAMIPCDGRAAYAALPTEELAQRGLGTEIDAATIASEIDGEAILRHAPGAFWYEKTRADHHMIATDYGTLQFYVAMLLDPSAASVWHPKGSSAPKPNSSRRGGNSIEKAHAPLKNTKSKEGRFRSHLQGKRVDFSGRTVITPDPELDIDEVRLPYHYASKWTVPEKLNAINYSETIDAAERRRLTVRAVREKMQKYGVDLLKDLPDRAMAELYNDASLDPLVLALGGQMSLYIWNEEGTERYDYTELPQPVHQHALARRAGSVIDRPVREGDYVGFNRAPSLHLVSFMLHRVLLVRSSSVMMSPLVCPPYNADFDGDEVTIVLDCLWSLTTAV